LKLFRDRLNFCSCGYDLRRINSVKVNNEADTLVSRKVASFNYSDFRLTEPFGKLLLNDYLYILDFFLTFSKKEISQNKWGQVVEHHDQIQEVNQIFLNWPQGYYDYLAKLRLLQSSNTRNETENYKIYSTLNRLINKTFVEEKFEPLSIELNKFVFSNIKK
jgi:hypothetical protein